MQLPSTAEQKPHVLVQCEQRNLVASQLGGGVPTGKGWRPKQGFSMGQYGPVWAPPRQLERPPRGTIRARSRPDTRSCSLHTGGLKTDVI